MKTTENYGLPQFEQGDKFNIEDINKSFKDIDLAIADLQKTFNTTASGTPEIIINEVIEARIGESKLKYFNENVKNNLHSLSMYLNDYRDLKSMIESSDNNIIRLPSGLLKISETINVPDNTTLIGYNTIIEKENGAILSLGNNCIIKGIKFKSTATKYLAKNIGIDIVNKSNIKIYDCLFEDIGFNAINISFSNNITINDCTFNKIGYSAIGCSSCRRIIIDNIYIDTIYCNSNLQGYGVYFSRKESDDIELDYPSSNCIVKNSYITNVSTWEALDTHGGQDIHFINNKITNCKVGIVMGESQNSSGAVLISNNYCSCVGNKITLNNKGYGISVGSGSNTDSTNNIIKENILTNCGVSGATTSGSIRLTPNCINTVIKDNIINDSNENGIVIGANSSVIISDNIINKTKTSGAVSYGVNLVGDYITANISNNIVVGIADNTSSRGFQGGGGVNSKIIFNNNITKDVNINAIGFTIKNTESSSMFNGVKITTGTGEPTIELPNGSIYVRANGSTNTTLYIRENNSWVAK